MLTKTLKFDDDVLDVLKGMSWSEDGMTGKILVQLDRNLYTRVNKALEAMGGKWNRKAGGHIFPKDPRPTVEGLLDSGTLEVARDGFFESPRAVVDRMIELVPLLSGDDTYYLEPEAGAGAIVRVLIEHGVPPELIDAYELNSDRAQQLQKDFPGLAVQNSDFLEATMFGYHRIYMNPPFEQSQDIKHVQHAYSLLEPGGAMVSVMGEGPFFRGDAIASDFRKWLENLKYFGSEVHVEQLPEGSFKESGTMIKARLVVIKKALNDC